MSWLMRDTSSTFNFCFPKQAILVVNKTTSCCLVNQLVSHNLFKSLPRAPNPAINWRVTGVRYVTLTPLVGYSHFSSSILSVCSLGILFIFYHLMTSYCISYTSKLIFVNFVSRFFCVINVRECARARLTLMTTPSSNKSDRQTIRTNLISSTRHEHQYQLRYQVLLSVFISL